MVGSDSIDDHSAPIENNSNLRHSTFRGFEKNLGNSRREYLDDEIRWKATKTIEDEIKNTRIGNAGEREVADTSKRNKWSNNRSKNTTTKRLPKWTYTAMNDSKNITEW